MKIFLLNFLAICVLSINAQNFEWTPQNSGLTGLLNDVFFVDNQSGWAVGDNGVVLNTTNGGQTWLPQTSGVTSVLRAVFFLDANVGWAVGGSVDKAMIKTTDGGSNWESMTAGNISSNLMYDISFFDANTGWLLTYDSIYRTSDGGNNWIGENYVSSVDVPRSRAIAITSDTIAYVAGSMKKTSLARQATVFYRRPENFPNLWSSSGFDPSVSDDHFMSIDFINADIGFAGGQRGQLYKKTDFSSGGPWELNFELQENQMIRSISFSNESDGMFNTSIEISGVTNALIYHTSNSGETWSTIPDTIPDLLLAVLHSPDSVNAWIVGLGGKIYKGVPSIAGINQKSLNVDVSIFPNPTTDLVSVEIKSKNNNSISYSLSDMSGRIIEQGNWSLKSSNSRFSLNLSDVIEGVYILRLSTKDGQGAFRVLKN